MEDMMSRKKTDPVSQVWHWSLMLFGIAILLTLTVSLLSKILIWLLGGLALAVAIAVLVWWRRRLDRW